MFLILISALPTPSPVYYKPIEPSETSPEVPAPDSAPEPAQQPPSSPDLTPSPVYYKYPTSSDPSPEINQEPKNEEEVGYSSQNFISEANFQIPEFFRTFLNTPPKWINMNNW